jgi:Cof subfamily protein (haloacid dehalogenase superfamily)
MDPRDVAAVGELRSAGMTVIVCTGRPFPGALPWVERLGLEGPIVCYQGAQVRELDGNALLDHGIPHDVAMDVVRFARDRKLHVQAYRDDELIVEHDREEAQIYARHAGMLVHVVRDLDEAMGATTPKLVIVALSEMLESLLPVARTAWKDKLNVATSTPEYLEFTSIESDKASALRFVCDRLGIKQDQVAAVGDGRNDATMIEWAGFGVAVEGSPPEVIAAADRTIPIPGHGGIPQLAEALLR